MTGPDRGRWTAHRISSDLTEVGLKPGDTVMVHASLRRIGPVEGGADGVIDAITDTIGPDGTMMMVLGARDDHAWVNRHPEAERSRLLADAIPFDPRVTPADPDVGVLAEVFRNRPRTVVSDHPEGRFAASGRLAEHLTTRVPWDEYFGAGSPLERLVDAGGLVLRLGADLDTVTAIHHAEYLADVPDKRRVRRHRLVLGASGPEIRVIETLDDEDGIVDHSGEDYFAVILRAYLELGRGRTGMVGSSTCELLDASDLVAFAVRWMNEHLGR